MRKITNIVLRKAKGKVYYFDEKNIYQCVSVEEAKKMENLLNLKIREDGSVYFMEYYYYGIFENLNHNLTKKAICKMKVGDTLDDLLKILSNTSLEHRSKPEGLNRFILSIDKPIFVRKPENHKKNTFDYIYIDLNIITKWNQDRKEYIQNHIQEINKMVIDKLESNREFKKFDVPVNCLKASRITLRRDNKLEYVLELKPL